MSDNKVSRSIRSGGDAQGAIPEKRRGGPPPLAWLIIGLLVVLAAIAFLKIDGAREPVRPGPAATIDRPDSPTVVDPAPLPPVAPSTGPSGGPATPTTPTQ